MADASQMEAGQVLTLPWNRLPNYLICVVALTNLIAGIVALRVAYGFAMDTASLEDAIAPVFIGLFGLLFVWVAWCFRTGVLPVRFVADAGRRECGFRWGPWWNGRTDLSKARRLVGELRFHKQKWHWAILASAGPPDGDEFWIYGPRAHFETQGEAHSDCERVIGQLAQHLALPVDIRTATQTL